MNRLMATCLVIAATVAWTAPALGQTTEGAAVRAVQPPAAEGPMAALFDSLI